MHQPQSAQRIMNLFSLTLKNLKNRRFTVGIAIFSIGLSLCLLLSVEKIRQSTKTSFVNSISGTDLIIGPRSGAEQLLLSSVFRIGHPQNSLSQKSYEFIKNHPETSWSIPIALGDSHKGFRVLATNNNYFQYLNYGYDQKLNFAHGQDFSQATSLVLGLHIAKELNYKIGSKIILAHGTGDHSHHHHDEHPFTVCGILQATGTPADFTLHVPLEGMALVHQSMSHDQFDPLAIVSEKQTPINALFVGLKTKNMIPSFQAFINNYQGEALSAIMPAVTLMELWRLLSVIEKSLMLISICVAFVSFMVLIAVMLSSLNERRREMAILRSLGASPRHILSLSLSESFLVSAMGSSCGFILYLAVISLSQDKLSHSIGLQVQLTSFSMNELWITLSLILAGTLAGIIPAIRLYNYSLTDGITPHT